jgi:hypothetical protein
MARLTHCTSVIAAAALLAVWMPCQASGDDSDPLVAVLALPSADTGQTSRATHELAQALIAGLRSAGLRVVVAGTPTAAPLEELTAVANAAAVDVAIGARSLESSGGCPSVLAPQAVSRPAEVRGSQARPAVGVKQLIAALRYEASVRLAASVESYGRWCHPKAARGDTYVLQGVAAPTVLLLLPVREQAQLSRRLPALIRDWSAAERARE